MQQISDFGHQNGEQIFAGYSRSFLRKGFCDIDNDEISTDHNEDLAQQLAALEVGKNVRANRFFVMMMFLVGIYYHTQDTHTTLTQRFGRN